MKTKTDKKAKLKLVKMRHKARIKARRPAHKKLLLHPATVFVMLCIGVLLAGATYFASADTLSVNAKVAADPIAEAATITSPTDGSHFKNKPIIVAGTCDYPSYIKLYRNGNFGGVVLCTASGNFNIESDLSAGANKFEAHIFNTTDDEGPLGAPVTVFYDAPVIATPSSSQPAKTPTQNSQEFYLITDYAFSKYFPGEQVSWKLSFKGGSPPFAVNVKWGDDTEDNYPANGKDDVTLTHVYKKSGDYTIKVTATDSAGRSTMLSVIAIIQAKKPTINLTGTTKSSSKPNYLWLAWPAYITFALMLASFWLGEKREYYQLIRRYGKRK